MFFSDTAAVFFFIKPLCKLPSGFKQKEGTPGLVLSITQSLKSGTGNSHLVIGLNIVRSTKIYDFVSKKNLC